MAPALERVFSEARSPGFGTIVSSGSPMWMPFTVYAPTVFALRTPPTQSPPAGSQLFRLELYYVNLVNQPTSLAQALLASAGRAFFHAPGQWWVALTNLSGLGEVATLNYELIEFSNEAGALAYLSKDQPCRVSDITNIVIPASGSGTLLECNAKVERRSVRVTNTGKGLLGMRWGQVASGTAVPDGVLQQYQSILFGPNECPLSILTYVNLDAVNGCTAHLSIYE